MGVKRVGLAVAIALSSVACGGSDQSAEDSTDSDAAPAGPGPSGPGASGTPDAPSTHGSSASGGSTAAGDSGSEASGATPPPPIAAPSDPGVIDGNGNGTAGVLTAGTWDDNRNFDFFTAYRKRMAQSPGVLPFAESDFAEALAAFAGARAAKDTLDVALVIDTTGSMGDEISYLQAEFITLSDAISKKYPNADQRWSLVLYRDQGDDYLTHVADFDADRTSFQAELSEAKAEGGGDVPEAPEAGLSAAAKLSWRDDESTARLAFWVGDAPHHLENANALARAIDAMVLAGVHLYPVASSGVDELTELSMRSAAQLTGGRYLFLTDDSGVGGAHKEPTLPCYFVTKLDDAILRMVDIELTGEYREPAPSEIVRTGGNPKNGRCALASGEIVQIY